MHEGAGSVEALLTLGESDGDGFGAAVGEGGDGGWEMVRLVRLLCESECWRCDSCGGRSEKKAATVEHGCD
jgi:hypothetical protein